jgi:hypothetical protein
VSPNEKSLLFRPLDGGPIGGRWAKNRRIGGGKPGPGGMEGFEVWWAEGLEN